jgi:hypothetical protein
MYQNNCSSNRAQLDVSHDDQQAAGRWPISDLPASGNYSYLTLRSSEDVLLESWCSINGTSIPSIPSLPGFDGRTMFLMPSLCRHHDSMIDPCYFPMFCGTIFTEIKYFINQPTANTVAVHTPRPMATVRASNQCYWDPPDDAPSPRRARGGGAASVVNAVLKSFCRGGYSHQCGIVDPGYPRGHS